MTLASQLPFPSTFRRVRTSPATGLDDSHKELESSVRRARLLAGAESAAIVVAAPAGLRVEVSDPPDRGLSPGTTIPVQPSMVAVIGLLCQGHLRWSLLPPPQGFAHAALIALPSRNGARRFLVIANRDRADVLAERALRRVGTLASGRTTGAVP